MTSMQKGEICPHFFKFSTKLFHLRVSYIYKESRVGVYVCLFLSHLLLDIEVKLFFDKFHRNQIIILIEDVPDANVLSIVHCWNQHTWIIFK